MRLLEPFRQIRAVLWNPQATNDAYRCNIKDLISQKDEGEVLDFLTQSIISVHFLEKDLAYKINRDLNTSQKELFSKLRTQSPSVIMGPRRPVPLTLESYANALGVTPSDFIATARELSAVIEKRARYHYKLRRQ